jgi:phage terminase small subunit
MSAWWEGLTEKRRRFCEEYSSNGGNATRAAVAAGYKLPRQEGSRLLTFDDIKQALEKLRSRKTSKRIATREERQNFWTETMLNEDLSMRDRLRASDLLGKSQADFIERHEHTGANGEAIAISIYIPDNGRDKAN